MLAPFAQQFHGFDEDRAFELRAVEDSLVAGCFERSVEGRAAVALLRRAKGPGTWGRIPLLSEQWKSACRRGGCQENAPSGFRGLGLLLWLGRQRRLGSLQVGIVYRRDGIDRVERQGARINPFEMLGMTIGKGEVASPVVPGGRQIHP